MAVSAAAMVLAGSVRPVFHVVVNRVFGPELNGRAAAGVALIFLASLPATAGVPTGLVRFAYAGAYAAYVPLTAGTVWPLLCGGRLARGSAGELVRYNVLWLVAAGTSLAARELAILVLGARVEARAVGELSVALSLL